MSYVIARCAGRMTHVRKSADSNPGRRMGGKLERVTNTLCDRACAANCKRTENGGLPMFNKKRRERVAQRRRGGVLRTRCCLSIDLRATAGEMVPTLPRFSEGAETLARSSLLRFAK